MRVQEAFVNNVNIEKALIIDNLHVYRIRIIFCMVEIRFLTWGP
jgi:hypothetical protein